MLNETMNVVRLELFVPVQYEKTNIVLVTVFGTI